MTPRPRTATDADILDAAARAIGRVGPNRLTLAHVAEEVGLAPATLVQRFGSKRELLLALVQHGVDTVDACFEAARARHHSPLAALIDAASDMARHVESPEQLANSLAFLQLDLSDPDFHRLALLNSHRIVDGYRALIDDAVAAEELEPCDSARLARVVQAMSGGSLINWAIHRQGTVLGWVRADLETVLAPLRRTRQTRSGVPRVTGRVSPRAR